MKMRGDQIIKNRQTALIPAQARVQNAAVDSKLQSSVRESTSVGV